MTGGILMCQGQFGKTAPLEHGQYGIFLVLSLFFYLPSLKSGTHTQTKNTFLKLTRQGLLDVSHKVLRCYLYNYTLHEIALVLPYKQQAIML